MSVTTAGRQGSDIRSDCWVSFEPKKSGGLNIKLKSKVESMYGDNLRNQIDEVLAGLSVKHANVEVEDYGALPFVIAARVETAVKRSGITPPTVQEGQYLPEMKPYCMYGTSRDRFRRSRLYLPGNQPKMFINAGLHKPDGVILDLEDSVSIAEKDSAQVIVRNALRQVNFYGSERMVRINQGERGLEDLAWIVPHNVHVILLPKTESPDQVVAVDERITRIMNSTPPNPHLIRDGGKKGEQPRPFLVPIIESALGGMKAYEIATASPNIVGLALGLEDYTADIGTQRTLEGRESFWLRSVIVNAARAAGIMPFDTVFSDVGDMDGLVESVIEAKSLGFDGKGCIHPRQILPIHKAFAPSQVEIDKATKIVIAFDQAERDGLGVVSLGSKMIDPPVVKRALRSVKMAESLGMLEEGWREV